MSGPTKRYALTAKQGDRATRYVEVTLKDDGEPYIIPEGSHVTSYIRKPDRKKVYNDCEFSGEVVTVELTSQALAVAGTARCEIEIKSEDMEQLITSITFEVEIEPKVKDEDAIESTDEMTILEKKMKQYDEAEKERVNAEILRKQEEKSRVSAENERILAEDNRSQEEDKRTQAEANREKSESERVYQENIRIQNEKERLNAETLRKQEEEKRVNAESARVHEENVRANAENERIQAEAKRVQAENLRQQNVEKALDDAKKAIDVANQINEASYIMDADSGTKYAYAIYAHNKKPHMALTKINEE